MPEGGLIAPCNPPLLPEENKQTPDTCPTDDRLHLEDIFPRILVGWNWWQLAHSWCLPLKTLPVKWHTLEVTYSTYKWAYEKTYNCMANRHEISALVYTLSNCNI